MEYGLNLKSRMLDASPSGFSTSDMIENVFHPEDSALMTRRKITSLYSPRDFETPVNWTLEDKLMDELRQTVSSMEGSPAEKENRLILRGILENAGYPRDQIIGLEQSGALADLIGIQAQENGAFRKMTNAFRYSKTQSDANYAFGEFMMYGLDESLKRSERLRTESLKYKDDTDDDNFLSDMLIASANTLGTSWNSSVRGYGIVITSAGVGALLGLAGGPGGAAAGASKGAAVGKALAKTATWYRAGLEQAGADFYELSQIRDSNGNGIDIRSDLAKGLFFLDALVNGGIEIIGMDWMPGYRQLFNLFDAGYIKGMLTKTIGERIRHYGVQFVEGLAGESMEEFFQSIVSDTLTNAIKAKTNEDNGADFKTKSWTEVISNAAKSFAQAAYGMIAQSLLGTGTGAFMDTARLALASKEQDVSTDPSVSQGTISRAHINMERAEQTETASSTEKDGRQQSEKAKEKIPAINVVQTRNGVYPATKKDADNLRELDQRKGAGDNYQVLVQQVSVKDLKEEDRQGAISALGTMVNESSEDGELVVGYSSGRIIVRDDDARAAVREELSAFADMQDDGGNFVVTPFSRNGQANRIEILTQAEAEEQGIEVRPLIDWSARNGMENRPSYRISEADFLRQQEAQDSFITLLARTTGIGETEARRLFEEDFDSIEAMLPAGVTMENLSSAAKYVPIMSDITGRSVSDLLSDGMVGFEVTGDSLYVDVNTNSTLRLDEATGRLRGKDLQGNDVDYAIDDTANVARAGADTKTENGYTRIRIYRDAKAEDITHELMHMTRRLASPERLEGFKAAYGAEDLWIEDIKDNGDGTFTFNGTTYDSYRKAFEQARVNEERFVNDFFRYLSTAEAPNEQVRGFFEGLKRLLNEILQKFREILDPSTVRAFDRLLSGDLEVRQGQTVDEALEASEATLMDEVPFDEEGLLDYNDYSDEAEEAGLDAEGNRLYSLSPDKEYGDVTFDDFHIDTTGVWEKVDDNVEIKNREPDFTSPSGSAYWYDRENGVVYRTSDHWGRVRSCYWDLDDDSYSKGRWATGRIKLTDLKREESSKRLYSLSSDRQWQTMDANTQRRIEADYERVYNEYHGTDKWMKAPNGQPTNLTERQWVQVRTPAFKAWFGDWENDPEKASKVLDKNGEPQVMYHGTNNTFSIFDRKKANAMGRFGDGFYFSEDSANASLYGHPLRVFLRIINPVKPGTATVGDSQLRNYLEAVKADDDEFSFDNYGQNVSIDTVFESFKDKRDLFDVLQDVNATAIGNFVEAVKLYNKVNGTEYDGIITPQETVVFSPNQIKSATDNVGTFSNENDNTLYSLTEVDRRYFEAINSNDMDTAQAIVNRLAEERGYFTDSSYQGTSAFNGVAPSSNAYYETKEERRQAYENESFEGDASLGDYADGVDPMNIKLFLTNPNMARTDFAKESVKNIKNGLKNGIITMYRSVPDNVVESSFRNGDWVTPSKAYAIDNAEIHGWDGYNIIEQTVSIDDVWWDGNDINEWGYDDGNGYAYQNTENNRKLLDVITRDENGNIIPPSQRFNPENDSVLYSLSPERQAEVIAQRKAEIQRAVEAGIYVRTEYLNEFRGEEWAQDELNLRDWMGENPDVVSMAKEADTLEDFRKAYGKSMSNSEGETEPSTDTSEDSGLEDSWFERIFSYAHALSSEDRDRQFANEWTATEDKTLELARTLANYRDAFWKAKPQSRSGGYWYTRNVWGAFKGVSTKLLKLSDGKGRRTNQRTRSSSAEIQEVQNLIRSNPRAYRNALMAVMMAESRASQVNAGLQTGIGADADWMQLEQIDDDISQEISEIEEKAEDARRLKTDYRANLQDIRQKISDAERDIRQAGEDPDKLDVDGINENLKGIRQRVKELSSMLSGAEREVDRIIERMGGNIERLEAQSRKDLEAKRARIRELRSQLTEARRNERRLQSALDAKTRLLEAREAKAYREKRIRQILRLSNFNSGSIDASFEESLLWVQNVFERSEEDIDFRRSIDEEIAEKKSEIDTLESHGENADQSRQELLTLQKQKRISRMVEPPAQLAMYLPEGYLVRADNRQSMWTAEELDTLLSALKLMRADGRQMLESREAQRSALLLGTAYSYFREVVGRNARVDEEGAMSSGALRQDVHESLKEGTEAKGFRRYRLWNAKLQRLARILDGDREGVLYDWFVRRNYQHQSEEITGIRRRLDAGSAEWRRLGLKSSDLKKEGYKGTKTNGTEYSLTRAQMIGVYIYNNQELGREKLMHANGNALSEESISEIVSLLTPEEKAWADFMVRDLSDNYSRLRDVYYRGWNMNLGERENYFTFVPADSVSQAQIDSMGIDPQGDLVGHDGKMYVNKSFTKQINPNAIYPMNLDVTQTWARQVRKQEHFIAYGEWAKDTQYLLDKGQLMETMGRVIGLTEAKDFEKIVNSVIGGQMSSNDFDRAWIKVLCSRNSAVLIGNTGTIIKQAPSFFAAFNGDISLRHLINGDRTLQNFLEEHPDILEQFPDIERAVDFIYANAPEMKDRQIDIDIMDSLNAMDNGAVTEALRKANNKISRYTMQYVDKMVVNALWMSRYYTVFDEQKALGRTDMEAHAEAAFKASQFISETQPTSMRMDQAAVQVDAKTSSFLRGIMVFTNQVVNTFNQMFLDVPMAFRQKNWRKGIAKIASSMLMVGVTAMISGKFWRRGDEDDEKYWFRFAREILATAVQAMMPGFGSIVGSALEYDSDYSSYIFGLDTIGSSLRKVLSPSGNKSAWEKISDVMIELGTEAGYAIGVPVTPIKNVVKAVENGNPAYLLTGTWGQIVESYR